jgi:two-component system response regulator QseB
MRLLIIEDNKELAYNMKEGLDNLGFIVDVSNLGLDGEEKAFVNSYDVILLDLNLPDKDGLDILKYLRSNGIDTPIIIVTARDEIKELAKGLDLGADDYIRKPFEIVELRARIQAVIRRFYGRSNPNIVIGSININAGSRKVTIDNKEVPLAVKEFDILEYIANRHPDVVSSEDIAEHIYDEFFDPMSSVLRVHIAKLKKKLKEVSGRDIIKTTRGKGYSIWEE